jgi:hypothetical protein
VAIGSGVGRRPAGRSRGRQALTAFACCAAVGFSLPSAAAAQRSGSRLLETDHWANEYIRRLRSAGYLSGLDPLAQPYRRAEVARGLAALGADSLREPVASWVRLLHDEFAGESREGHVVRAGGVLLGGLRAANTRRLDVLRALDSGSVWPRGAGGVWVETGPLAAGSRVLFDTYLKDDPDGRSPGLRMGGLNDQTYVSLASGGLGAVLGRFSRNWSLPGASALLVSDNALSFPQIGFEGVFGRFAVQAFTGELDTLGGRKRYLAAHRIAYVAPQFVLAVTEGMLYGSETGPSLQYLNPLSTLLFDHENPPGEELSQNLMLGAQVWYRRGSLDVYGEGLLDDIAVHRDTIFNRRAPTRYALRLGGRWRPVGPRLEAGVEYERVSSYAYRSFRPSDRFDYLSRGLGVNFADYDRAAVVVDLFPGIPGLRVSPLIQLLRQGEGDYRIPFPGDPVFLNSPSLFLGVTERTYRVALQGRYQPVREVWVTWDMGENLVRNAGHVGGQNASRFVALGTLQVRLEWPR